MYPYRYIDINDWAKPVIILHKISSILEQIIVGKYKERILPAKKNKIKCFLFILLITEREIIPPFVVPKKDISPNGPISLSVILK